MKKVLLPAALITGLLAAGAYYFYRSHFTDLVAQAILADSLPPYIPKRMQEKIESLSRPINKSTEAMVAEMDASGVPLEKILSVIDETTEQQAYAMLDEINSTDPQNPNEVFNIVTKYINPDFDVEILRKPFNEHVTMKHVEKAVQLAKQNRKTHDVDFLTARAILKEILLQKKKAYQTRSDQ